MLLRGPYSLRGPPALCRDCTQAAGRGGDVAEILILRQQLNVLRRQFGSPQKLVSYLGLQPQRPAIRLRAVRGGRSWKTCR